MKLTLMRENGVCEVRVNGLLDEEFEKMKAYYEKKLAAKEAELQTSKEHCGNLLTRDLSEFKVMLAKPATFFGRVKERIIITWCQIWGLGEVFKCWSYDPK